MNAYPIVYTQNPPVKRRRLTVFFRLFMLIPHAVVSFFYGIAAFFVLVFAWFAIVFTARYPAGMYNFVAGWLRFQSRMYAYALLVVDEFPPFDGGEHPEYPVQIKIAAPAESYSRLKAFFRFILAIPILIVQYAFEIWLFVVAVGIWFVAVIMGTTSPGLTEAMRFPFSYYVRSTGYMYLLTDQYPPFSETETYVPVAPAAA